jgi:hypothetical protein
VLRLKSAVALDTLNHVENTEKYSGIRPKVDGTENLVWGARVGNFSLQAIQQLLNSVQGTQLNAWTPSGCSCDACIMGKMFRRPFQCLTLEDKAKTRLLELIHSDLIWPIQNQRMRENRNIIMFTDDYSRYTEVYCMKLMAEAPAKFKECVIMVEKQHSQPMVCRIRVDSGGENGSRETFLDYLAQ